MKTSSALLLACTLAFPSFAQGTNNNAAPQPATNQVTLADSPSNTAILRPSVFHSDYNQMKLLFLALPVSSAAVSAPLILTNGCLSQPERTELADGGKAVFNFTITKAGNYVLQAMVNAPGEDSNSFYVNVDAPPEDPAMIWDIDVTNGFEERTVSWRGNGTAESDEIVPKRFNLSAGAHKLIIVGREPAQLKSISIRPAAN